MLIKYNVESNKIKFDEIFYKRHHPDLQHLNNDDLINHYIKHGKAEKRLFCDIQLEFNWMQYKIDKKLDNSIYNNIHKIWEHYLYYEIININRETVILKHINEILVNIEFNSYYYAKKHPDLIKLNNVELFTHYNDYGRKEHRIFTERLQQFNFVYYYLIHTDLNFDNIDDLWRHYIYYGIKEKRHCDFNTIIKFSENNLTENQKFVYLGIIPTRVIEEKRRQEQIIQTNNKSSNNKSSTSITISKINSNNFNSSVSNKATIPTNGKTLVIYVYYNRPGEYKNETNLAFFIHQTIKKRDSIKDNIEFLFIINNYYTEVNIPIQKNVHILKNKNCFDFEAYLIGINYMEKTYSNKIQNLYNYVMFMNCSCTGPFTTNNNSWLTPFINKLNSYTVCCSTILTIINNNNYISGPQIPGYCFLVKSEYINLLIKPNNIFKNDKKFSNTVFGPKKNKYDCIISGEHSISIVLLNNNLNIASICNDNLDYRQKINSKKLLFSADRHTVFNYSLYKSIFIKNHWRIDNSSRDCHPVMWSQTKKEIENLNNMLFINYENNSLDFSLLPIKDKGNVLFNKSTWSSKNEFGGIFANSEEFIVFPKSNCSKTINYYHNDKIIKKYIIEGIKSLLFLNYKIIFHTNIQNPFNFKIPNSIEIVYNFSNNSTNTTTNNNNNNLSSDLLFPCTDFNTFQEELKHNKFDKSIIKIEDYESNKEKYINNKYINFLTMYQIS